ncbi:hypothetical protein [Dokdonia sp.]|uniref:hypothetical protein n=1 Tax=Dokdonia sp. TaxID=2024995 RepID=UPI0032646857
MKCIIYLLIFFISTILYCQDSYIFDQVLEYEIQKPSESVRKDVETRYYFINTQDNSYVAIAILREGGTYSLVFRDDKKDKIAELTVPGEAIFNANDLRINKKAFKGNKYRNPVYISDYDLTITPHDSLQSIYNYSYNKSESSNRYLTKNHVMVVDQSVDRSMIGVGFGDYYSLLPWKDKFPKGLIRESLTERLDGSVVSYCSLMNVVNRNKTFVIE